MNVANGPLVVIPEPIRSMGWTYDVERSILEPLGIRLLVPDTAEEDSPESGGDGGGGDHVRPLA